MYLLDRSRRGPVAVLLVLALICLAGAADAKVAVIKTVDGGEFEGELIRQTPSQIVISVGGIEATFNQSQIAQVTFRDSPEDLYERKRKALDDSDFDGRMELAREMYELDALNLAKFELNQIDRDFPNVAAVNELLGLIDAKLRLKQTQGTATRKQPTRKNRTRPGQPNAAEGDPVYLTEEQINLIKVYEIDLEQRPRVTIPRDVLDEFFTKYGNERVVPLGRKDRAEFRRKPGYEQLDLFFQVQARDLYGKVQVKQDPKPMATFRRSINPRYVAKYFAPMFGSGQIPGLELLVGRPDSVEAAYTNFYLLSQFSYEGLPMIDRANPEQSLLLQWGLERDAARSPAPEIEGWKPEFNSTDDSSFQQYVEWITTLYPDEPDYGIVYPAPEETSAE